ncbi:MAG: ElyC/SanA/YdcF family protein [Anaerolineae bacterium]|nr:ElyC/SanA/YdcF family protein [Anaerolineae bacterium]
MKNRPDNNHWWRKLRLCLGILISCGAAAMGLAVWSLWSRFSDSMVRPSLLHKMQQRPVAIVFGAGVWPDGSLSMVLKDRLDAAIELYQAGKVHILLFSGDNRVVDYNEPQKMLEYALAKDIPRGAMVLDYAGRRTYDTCYRARDIFGVSEAIVVTQRFHLPRTIETCRGLGLDVVGYIADRRSYPRRFITWYWIREIPALWRAWVDIYISHPKPVLGEPLPIFAQTRP